MLTAILSRGPISRLYIRVEGCGRATYRCCDGGSVILEGLREAWHQRGIIGLIAGIASYFGNKRRAKKKRAKSGGATATAQYPGYGQPQPQEWQAPGQDGHQYGESMNSGGNQPYMQDGRYIGDPWSANSTNTSGFNEEPNPR